MPSTDDYKSYRVEDRRLEEEPFYLPRADEIELFAAAHATRTPVLLKGPTGTGKTRFVEHMAWRLGQPGQLGGQQAGDHSASNATTSPGLPLVTVACHEDLTASDLIGRYLLDAEGTRWMDGPLTSALKSGAMCYLDEVVEARADTTVVVHPVADHRRALTIDKLGVVVEAAPGFFLVVSYNPGYQGRGKEMKRSMRQRFMAIEFQYPSPPREAEIVAHETGLDGAQAMRLAELAASLRQLRDHGMEDAVSTRALVHAARLIGAGIAPRRACQSSIVWSVSDDPQVQAGVEEVVSSYFA